MSNIVSLTDNIIQNTISINDACNLLHKNRKTVVNILDYFKMDYKYIKKSAIIFRVSYNQLDIIKKFLQDNSDTREFFRTLTCLNKYGVKNPAQSEDIKSKTKQTNIDKYGVDNPFKSGEIKDKIKTICLDKYGVDHPMKSKDIQSKSRKTCLSKYGVEYSLQSKDIRLKSEQTCISKYGVHSPLQSEDVKKKVRSTCLSKYGVDYPLLSKDIQSKAIETNLLKYGVRSFSMTDDYKSKFTLTCLNRYGCNNPMECSDIKRKSLSHKGMTSPEKKLNEFLINRGFDFQYEYECNGKNFDFAIFNEGQLSVLLEIDGEYFHGLLNDYDNKHVHGDKDCERFSKVPEGVKFIACDSMNIDKCFDELLNTFCIDYNEWIQRVINSLPIEFPYPNYSSKRLTNDFNKLKSINNIDKSGRLADSTIRQFHKSIWSAHVGSFPSPVEAWQDKELLENCVRNRFIYSSSLSSQAIVNGFNVCKLAPKVSVFSASLAKYLVQKYLNEYDTIFDPFSGFSGRMLGTCACGKKYIGQDINEEHVKESNEVIKFHNLDADVVCKDILDSRGSYDCLFTCPPYGNKENWGSNNVVKSCDEWIGECLNRFSCNRYLFVVDETSKYRDHIVEKIHNKYHFNSSTELVIFI